MRAAVPGAGAVRWRGAGPGGRFARERSQGEKRSQNAARARLERVGLGPLDQVSSIDCPPPEPDEG